MGSLKICPECHADIQTIGRAYRFAKHAGTGQKQILLELNQ